MNWRDLPSLSALRAFCAFSQEGTMSAAGAALNVSHAAISQQLRGLEEHLGVALLDRSGARPVMTEAGQRLADALEAGFGTIHREIEAMTGRDADRPLQISTTPAFASGWLLPRLAGFRAAHPDVSLMIDPTSALRTLAPGGVDAAVRFGAGHWTGLEAELLVSSPIAVVAAPELVGDAVISSPADLRPFHWLQELGTGEAQQWLHRHGAPEGFGKGVTTLPGNLLLEAARQGQGVAIIAKAFVEADLEAGRLRLLFEDERHKGYHLVTRRGVQRPALRAFTRWLRKEVDAGRGARDPARAGGAQKDAPRS